MDFPHSLYQFHFLTPWIPSKPSAHKSLFQALFSKGTKYRICSFFCSIWITLPAIFPQCMDLSYKEEVLLVSFESSQDLIYSISHLQIFLFSDESIALSCENTLAILRILALKFVKNPFDFLPISPM